MSQLVKQKQFRFIQTQTLLYIKPEMLTQTTEEVIRNPYHTDKA